MCELLGMNANVPTDICFSFSGLIQRGGKTGPHKDGWGIAFYEGKASREFRDPEASIDSPIAHFLRDYPIRSRIIISHIRQANSGKVSLENTHPFSRELWGRQWTYAHNGQLKKMSLNKCAEKQVGYYQTIGSTDSELAFCWMLNRLRERFDKPPKDQKILNSFIHDLCLQLSRFGVFNMLLSDSKHLFAFCSSKLHWITRKAPFGAVELADDDVCLNFKEVTTPKDIVTVIATSPLTKNESWNTMETGEFVVFKNGRKLRSDT